MRILHLSDTNGKHHLLKTLPKADVIIHSGDTSFSDTENEVLEFLNWFFDLDYPNKIFVAGNHDDCLYDRQIEDLPDNCYCLCYSGIKIEGVNFWGVPLFIADHKQEGRVEKLMKQIPENTGVLISQSPPYGILDFENNTNHGSLDLLQVVLNIKPTYHLFGHIHAASGIEKSNNTIFVNASLMNEKNELVNKPILFEI
jgi:Icc-related predicted phosphoesterase